MSQFRVSEAYRPTGDQPTAIEALAGSIGHGDRYQTLLGATGHGQDGDDGLDRRAGAEADARDRAQQDAGRAALQRVPRVPARERGRVLRLVLRLLPAGGVRPAGRPLHREGRLHQRRHRPAAARGHGGAPGAQGRPHRRVGLLHLRDRLAGGVRGEDGRARRRPGDRPRRDAAEARRHPVRAQRLHPRARPLPGPGRRRRGAAGAHGVRLPRLLLRRRGRADHPLRPALGRDLRPPRAPGHLPGDAVRDLAGDDRAQRRRDQARARRAGEALRVAGEAPGGAPDPAAHRVRPGDAAGARLLQRDRELLAHPRRPGARDAAAHAARLLRRELRDHDRRVAPDRAPDRRHVRGRPLAQGDARRARLPPSRRRSTTGRCASTSSSSARRSSSSSRPRLGRSSCATRRTSPSRSSARPASSTPRSSCARRRTRSTTS